MYWGYLVAKTYVKVTGIWWAKRKVSARQWDSYIYYG